MIRWAATAVVTAGLLIATVAALAAGRDGFLLSDELAKVDLRQDSPGTGRVFVGGGLRGGK